jgi:hypothetical protein
VTFNLIVAALLLAAAGWAAWIRVARRRQAGAAAGWREVKGRVLDHDVEERFGTDSEGRPDYDYIPKITYRYEAGGAVRTGGRIGFETHYFANRGAAEKHLAQWPVGSEVTVYVNPDDPDEAALTREAPGGWWVVGLFVALAAAVALGLFDGGEAGAEDSAPQAEAVGQT